MVNFDPPARRALSDAELFKILSEIPADSEGMERAANLMGEQERLREEDDRAYQRWLEDLKSDGSDEAQAALAALFPAAATAPVAQVPEEPTGSAFEDDFSPATVETMVVRTNQVSFESLVTGSQPIAVTPESEATAAIKTHRADASWLQLPLGLLLAILISGPTSGLDAIIGLGGGALVGACAFLAASRGGPADLGALFTASFGVIAGRMVFAAVAMVTLIWALVAAAELSWSPLRRALDLPAEVFEFALPAIAAAAIILGLVSARWFGYLIAAVALAALGWLIVTGSFAAATLDVVSQAIWLWLAIGFAAGFIAQSAAIGLARRAQFAFAPTFGAVAALTGFFALGLSVEADARLAAGVTALVALVYFVANRAMAAANGSGINPMWVVFGLVTATGLVLLPIDRAVQFALIAVFAAIGVAAADGTLRNLPLHIASTRRAFGFYGAASSSAIAVWLLAAAGSSALLVVFGLSDLDFGLVGAPAWVTAAAAPAVALASGYLLGLLRIRAIRNRELDQESASGNQPLQNLLGL
jgi:hypothetical protein